ncbi:MAG: class I SAM-dependent methyltransferase [Candidatus Poribacteria bacterium]|nr:class I SAM-dependent methyltransferase [Candidatus Poribacteria bacterium]
MGRRGIDYALGRGAHETSRLIEQSRIYNGSTRRMLQEAGISEGMRVLEIGSGAGDVALMLAEMVGPEGHVVGVDMNASILETARARVRELGLLNVEFIAEDALALTAKRGVFDSPFDAVAGRFVLMYTPDPAETLARLATHLKPGGIAAFQEPEYTLYKALSSEGAPLMRQLIEWIVSAFERSGAHLDAGLALLRAFVEAGFSPPSMRLEAPIGAAKEWAGYQYMSTIFQSLLPRLERYGVASARKVDAETLAERLRAEVLSSKRPFFLPPHILAHAALKKQPA